MRLSKVEIIQNLGLEPLPMEGGYYKETYRSTHLLQPTALPDDYQQSHSLSTAIYYFLDTETHSALHRLPGDELFHFYLGDPVEMLMLYPDGKGRTVTLGQNMGSGQLVQHLVPAGVWQGSRLIKGGKYALMGTTMSPGFDFSDFEGGDVKQLKAAYPEWLELIEVLA